MRITGGTARGRSVCSPEGRAVRPTGAKVRQALFNILGPRIQGARFLDICAGSGLIGVEALSRGASWLVAIEELRPLSKAIEMSLKNLGFDGEVIAGDFRQVLAVLERQSFDIIFADPPYKSPHMNQIPLSVEKYDLLADGGILIVEHMRGHKFSEESKLLEITSTRNYGQTSLSFFAKTQD